MHRIAIALLGIALVLCSCARAPVSGGVEQYSYASRGVGGGVAALALHDSADEAVADLLVDELGRLGFFERIVRLPAGSRADEAEEAGADWLITLEVAGRMESEKTARVLGSYRWIQPTLDVYLECRQLPEADIVWSCLLYTSPSPRD